MPRPEAGGADPLLVISSITRRALELFAEPWDYVPADDASDEEWDAALRAHLVRLAKRKVAGNASS